MLQIIKKRPGQLDMTFEYIPYEQCSKSLRKYALNLEGKRLGQLQMTFEDIP